MKTPQPINYVEIDRTIANNPDIGLDGAYLIEVIAQTCEDVEIQIEGSHWAPLSYEQIASWYPTLGVKKTIKRLVKRLESFDLLTSRQFDRRTQVKFYRVNKEALQKYLK
jgi:hypothetical protein